MRIHTGHLSLLITLSKLTCITAITIEDFYQFGSEAGDAAIGRTLDGSSPPIILPSPFNFFGQSSNRMSINNNGHITPGTSNDQYIPRQFPILNDPLISVYWADADTQPDDGGYVWYRVTTYPAILQQASNDIQLAYSAVSYIDYILIATWDHVGYFPERTDKTNTFQCVLAVSGNQTYAIYLYADGLIQWTTSNDQGGVNGLGGDQPPVAGYNAGDGIISFMIPGSLTEQILNITSTSNVCVPGKWIFQLDEHNVVDLQCHNISLRLLQLLDRLHCIL